jgi:putative peptidoglycan lipid II flippase
MGLVAYSCIKVLSPAFYAIDHKWTPMLVSFASIALNVVLNWLFIFHFNFGHRGLALSTAIAATVNFLALYVLMTRFATSLETLRLLGSVSRSAIAAIGLGAVCWCAMTWLRAWLLDADFTVRLITLCGVIGVGAIVYAGLCAVLRVEAMQDALGAVLRKLRRRSA